MPDEKKVPTAPDYPVQVIARNDTEKKFSLFRIVKGKKVDKFYPAPDITNPEEWEHNQKWLGLPTIISIVQTALKRAYQDVFFDDEVLRPDGTINWEAFAKNAADFTAAGMKMAEIEDKLEELSSQLFAMLAKAEVGPDGQFDSATALAMKELNTNILQYKDMKEKRSRKKGEDAEANAEPAVIA